ncbi:MAG: tripartite tricarboxylate transporter substrate binding protein [Burkholderiales bacterium]|nr:tripartite tricarboxylate transporter substrate binding protein [Burkholderiales bacterium]
MHRLIRLAGLALVALAAAASAQEYPNRPVRLIVPQPPAGPSDIVARLVAQRLGERLGQPFVVENRPGAGSNIGTEMLAKAPKDGYTIGLATVQHIVNPFLFASLPFDAVRDFAPITLISKAHIVLVVNPETPAQTLRELIALARTRPGGLSWASAGNGGTSHLAIELFKTAAGVDVVHVPYKGTQPALTDVLGGRVPVMFDGVVTSLPHLRAGKLRALAMASLARSPLLPEVPTMTEAGLPGFEAVGLAAFMAPAGTPAEIIARLQRETAAVVQAPEVRDRLVAMGLEVVASTPADFADYLRSESAKWGKVIRDAKIRAE